MGSIAHSSWWLGVNIRRRECLYLGPKSLLGYFEKHRGGRVELNLWYSFSFHFLDHSDFVKNKDAWWSKNMAG